MTEIKNTSFCTRIRFSLTLLILSLLFLSPIQMCGHTSPILKHLKRMHYKEAKSGVKGVDNIYVINLDKRPEKWTRMENLLASEGMSAHRFSAVDGWSLSNDDLQELAAPYPLRMLPGETGCFLSHLYTIMDALAKGHKIAWIFEDDIEFVENPHQITKLIKELEKTDPSWDILYTDVDSKNSAGIPILALDDDFRPDRNFLYSQDRSHSRVLVSKNLSRLGQRYGMYSYLISRKGMNKLYNFYIKNSPWTAIDIDIHNIPSIREYATTRDIVSIWCKSPFSDTKEQHSN